MAAIALSSILWLVGYGHARILSLDETVRSCQDSMSAANQEMILVDLSIDAAKEESGIPGYDSDLIVQGIRDGSLPDWNACAER